MSHRFILAAFFIISLAIPSGLHAGTQTVTVPISSFATPAEIEEQTRTYFKDTPVMIEIARCESKFRQFTDSGNVLRSNGMIGVFQFFESIHTNGAKALGFDLATVDGNLGYAKHVYKAEGTTPWNGSSYCWKNQSNTTASTKATVAAVVTTPTRLELEAKIKKLVAMIKVLRQIKALQDKSAR